MPSSNEKASQADEPFDYAAWYNSPGNSIRKWDEEHGVKLAINPQTNIPYFTADRDILFADNLKVDTYPEYFKNRHIDDFKVNFYSYGDQRNIAETAYKRVIRYLNKIDEIMRNYDGMGLYFYSRERGTGKTFLSTILGNELSCMSYRVRWYNMTYLIQEIKDGYDRDSNTSSAQIIDIARNTPILILDDIGVEKQTAWLNETVYSILDYRLSHRKPTIFTSNKRPEELAYDERIIDRITRMTSLIQMPEESIRKKLRSGSNFEDYLDRLEG